MSQGLQGLVFGLFVAFCFEIRSCYAAQAGLELLSSGNALASTLQVARTTGTSELMTQKLPDSLTGCVHSSIQNH
jgi:hypothetical protein